MTNVAISGLPAAGALTGTELVPVVQSGVTSQATVDQISNLVLDTYIDARNYGIDPTGVNDSSVGGNLAIADAINGKRKLIWPSGVFKLNAPLVALLGPYDTLHMYGQGAGAPDPTVRPSKPPINPAVANTAFFTTYGNAPAIVLNNNNAVVMQDFALCGLNTAPSAASTLSTGPALDQYSYLTPGCQSGRYAPHCGIAIDPFSNSTGNVITGITQTTQAMVRVSTGSSANPFVVSQQIVFSGITTGMTQINGLTGTVTAIGGSLGAWTATVNIDSVAFTAYTSGGTAVGLPYCSGTISGITPVSGATQVVLSDAASPNPFQCGQNVTFSGIDAGSMTQINGSTGTITATGGSQGAWTVLVNIDSASFSPYTAGSGGQVVASDAYSSLATWYQPQFAGDGSGGLIFENLVVANFVVGVAIGLSGNSALAEDITFRNVAVFNCDVCYAIGQSQSRNLNVEYGAMTNARIGVDGMNYGAREGAPPLLLRQNYGHLYRIFALPNTNGNCVIQDGYAESIVSLGQYGAATSLSNYPLTFIGGDFSFGNPSWIQAPLLLEAYAPTTFLGTSILQNTDYSDVLNFTALAAPIAFERCLFRGTGVKNSAPHIGLTRDAVGYVKFVDCWVDGASGVPGGSSFLISNDMGRSWGVEKFDVTPFGGRLAAVYQTYRVSNGNTECIYLPPSIYPEIYVGGLSGTPTWSGTTMTFTCSETQQLLVGDILFWTILPQLYSLQSGYWVPSLKIASISGNTVTCNLLFDPAQYSPTDSQGVGAAVGVAPIHWAPTQALTGNTTSGSVTLAAVTPTTILQAGDFVSGMGIPTNTRVVSVTVSGSTASVQMSQSAIITASGTQLYFGRLYTLQVQPTF